MNSKLFKFLPISCFVCFFIHSLFPVSSGKQTEWVRFVVVHARFYTHSYMLYTYIIFNRSGITYITFTHTLMCHLKPVFCPGNVPWNGVNGCVSLRMNFHETIFHTFCSSLFSCIFFRSTFSKFGWVVRMKSASRNLKWNGIPANK